MLWGIKRSCTMCLKSKLWRKHDCWKYCKHCYIVTHNYISSLDHFVSSIHTMYIGALYDYQCSRNVCFYMSLSTVYSRLTYVGRRDRTTGVDVEKHVLRYGTILRRSANSGTDSTYSIYFSKYLLIYFFIKIHRSHWVHKHKYNHLFRILH